MKSSKANQSANNHSGADVRPDIKHLQWCHYNSCALQHSIVSSIPLTPLCLSDRHWPGVMPSLNDSMHLYFHLQSEEIPCQTSEFLSRIIHGR